jgi:hypothetical protein
MTCLVYSPILDYQGFYCSLERERFEYLLNIKINYIYFDIYLPTVNHGTNLNCNKQIVKKHSYSNDIFILFPFFHSTIKLKIHDKKILKCTKINIPKDV